jgi:hypothetical protein
MRGMDYSTLTTRFREWTAELRQIPAMSDSGRTGAPEWYAGLAVCPAAFSRQLGDMQLSLLRANKSRTADKQVEFEAGVMQDGSPEAVS